MTKSDCCESNDCYGCKCKHHHKYRHHHGKSCDRNHDDKHYSCKKCDKRHYNHDKYCSCKKCDKYDHTGCCKRNDCKYNTPFDYPYNRIHELPHDQSNEHLYRKCKFRCDNKKDNAHCLDCNKCCGRKYHVPSHRICPSRIGNCCKPIKLNTGMYCLYNPIRIREIRKNN